MCHRWHMARRKPDSQVGPLGVWAYDTARLLGRSSEQVAAAVKVSPVTIRKIEGGSNKSPSADLVRRMYDYFRQLAEDQHLLIDPPPGVDLLRASAENDPVAAAIDRQTEVITRAMTDLADAIWTALGGRPPKDPTADTTPLPGTPRDLLAVYRQAGAAMSARQDRDQEPGGPDAPGSSPRRPRRGSE